MPRRLSRFLILTGLVGLVLTGCGTRNKFLGTWESELDVLGQHLTVTHEFKPDLAYHASAGSAGITASVTGTYSFTAEKLTISGKNLEVKDDGSVLARMLVDKARTELEKRMKSAQTGSVEWRSDTEFAVQPDEPGVPLVVFRKKSS